MRLGQDMHFIFPAYCFPLLSWTTNSPIIVDIDEIDKSSFNMSTPNDQYSQLQMAMKVADAIRRNSPPSSNDDRLQIPPGLVEGTAAFLFTGALLLPVRKVVIKAAGERLYLLADLICTSGHLMASANAALYAGSLYGSRAYLQQLAQVPPTAPSETASHICKQIHEFQMDAPKTEIQSETWDPRQQTIQALQQALEHCRQ